MYKNKISIIGTGYVGLVGGVCLADFGNTIINVDINEEKIEQLKRGEVPIYEQGLQDMLDRNMEEGRISFTTDVAAAVEESEVIFISVGTPPDEDGSADLTAVLEVAKTIGQNMNGYKVVVDKSTVPVGTGRKVAATIQEQLDERGANFDFDVVSNPEFLREGKAVHDFTHPDRIVIGTESEQAREILSEVYRALYLNDVPFVYTNLETAEMIKYASNAFLATKISFINEMSVLSEKVGANVQEIARAMGMDGRISDKFLHSGPGYGGSCFPKDTRAIVRIANEHDVDLKVIQAGIEANEYQKKHMVEKITGRLDDLEGKTLGVLGLSFKPETDDMRESPALTILPELIEAGAKIRAYDPQAMEESTWRLKEYEQDIIYCANEYDTMKGSDALVLVTEWNQFRRLDLQRVKDLLANPVFFDLRNVYKEKEVAKYDIDYIGVGV
ncbi:UDP-glucose/GDP-mannose dehydrogenase family protein [Halanaerobiaceae bacterium Z-7014]|uniref:UDP-glucose 6-dehydrogenase n=1 Tax=Halonatronomonas betaini TaxID=2778430 RepID=A0A931APF4_9FIRM|nr:UDP-glucose/GDP-mannose dehydrogenase family protein [Halonatronomonas betaini]MBF8436548.1 UDP-glucose/GDP-mannose dehydrogenase family protein [Halonatronomonas betaini]